MPVGNPIPVSFSVPSAFVIFIYPCQRARLDARFKTRLRRTEHPVFVCLSRFVRVLSVWVRVCERAK